SVPGTAMIAAQIAIVLSGDPIGAHNRINNNAFMPLAGGTMTGNLDVTGNVNASVAVNAGTGIALAGTAYMTPAGAGTTSFRTLSGAFLGNIDGTAAARYLALNEATSDPAAPATNNAVVYLRDNGSGKSQLCVRFATGAVQVIATEP